VSKESAKPEVSLDFEYFPRGEEKALRLLASRPETGLAFKLHCFEVGPFRGGTGEKLPDGSVVFTYREGEMGCVTTFTPKPGGRVEMSLVVTGPLEELKKIRFIDGCMQHWESPAFRRRGPLTEFAGRCFIYTMRGPVSLLDTPRGKQKGFAPDSPWNCPACTQWYVPLDSQHPGDIWAFGMCGDRPVVGLIGAESRDGKWLTAIGIRYSLNVGQGWHDCLHCGGHTRWYLDEKESVIREKTMLYVMPNDKGKLLTAYREDLPRTSWDAAKSEPSDNQGLREPRPGGRRLAPEAWHPSGIPWAGLKLDVEPLGNLSWASLTSAYWETLVSKGDSCRIWRHPVANGEEFCVSVSSTVAKPGEPVALALIRSFVEVWTETAAPEGVPAKVFQLADGKWMAGVFWERPAPGDPAKGIGELQEPGSRTVSVRGRLVVCSGPEELIRQWKWAQEDWRNAVPYRMPAPEAEPEPVGSSVTFAPNRACAPKPATAGEGRETAGKERLTYGLTILPPWKDAGYLHVNFPEHLEYDGEPPTDDYVGYSILRHWDEMEYPWKISPDGRTASLRVESPHEKGVVVEARLVAQGAQAVIWMKITNGSKKRLPRVKPLLCFQYRKLEGFPQSDDENFKYTYVVIDGKLARLADIETANPRRTAMAAYVKGCSQHDCDKFAKGRGGLMKEELDCALTAVTSKDGRRKVVVAFEPPKSMLSNAAIPCFHADPCFGTLEPGESAEATGVVAFTEGELEPLAKELAGLEWKRGAGR
jgi:hypothetical protein